MYDVNQWTQYYVELHVMEALSKHLMSSDSVLKAAVHDFCYVEDKVGRAIKMAGHDEGFVW